MTELVAHATPAPEPRTGLPATATLWRVIVRWKTGEPANAMAVVEHQPQILMLTTADPSGAEVFAVVRARCKELDASAFDIRLLEVTCVAEVFGTVAHMPRIA